MKEYIEPIVEITLFTEDVVTASGDEPMTRVNGTTENEIDLAW